jgi:hypothetical protein
MNRRLAALTSMLGLCVLLISGCGAVGIWPVELQGSGRLTTLEKPIVGFDRVRLSHAFHVDIRQGEAFGVLIQADDNVVRYLRVIKNGTTLEIGLQPRWNYSIEQATLRAEVTMPELTSIDLRGACQATVYGFKSAHDLKVNVSAASHLQGNMDVADLRLDVTAASHVTLTGSAQDAVVNAWMASHVDLADLEITDANVHAHGASHVTVNPSGWLDVMASTASHVRYLGYPTFGNVNALLASTVGHR